MKTKKDQNATTTTKPTIWSDGSGDESDGPEASQQNNQHTKTKTNTQHQNKSGETSSKSNNTKYIELIQSDPDYLYRLVRTKDISTLFEAIDSYIGMKAKLPFDNTCRVNVFDVSLKGQNTLPTQSLLETAHNTYQISIVSQFIGRYFEKMNQELFVFIKTHQQLLRIVIMSFPVWFETFQYTDTKTGEVLYLCECSQKQIDINGVITKGDNNNGTKAVVSSVESQQCFCSQRDKIISNPNNIAQILQSSINEYGCLPCHSNGKFPNSITLTCVTNHSRHSNYTYTHKVNIEYASTETYQDRLIGLGQYTLAQEFISIITKQSILNQIHSLHADWGLPQQFTMYLSHINAISQSLIANTEPESFAKSLYILQTTLLNWSSIWCDYLRSCIDRCNKGVFIDDKFELIHEQQIVKQRFEQILFFFIHQSIRSIDDVSMPKPVHISAKVYNLLCHILKLQPTPVTTLNNPLLKHIFAFYLPYLCPYHIAVIPHVIPPAVLETFHPTLFSHFNSNSKPFQFIQQSSLSAKSIEQYNRIRSFRNEREQQPMGNIGHFNFFLFSLPMHPFSLLSSFISPYQYNHTLTPCFPQPGTTTTYQGLDRDFNQIPTFVKQLHSTIKTEQNIAPHIDPHFKSLNIPNGIDSCQPFQQHLIYFRPTIVHAPIRDAFTCMGQNSYDMYVHNRYMFLNGLMDAFNIQSLSGKSKHCFPIDSKRITNQLATSVVGKHNKDYFHLFHDAAQEEALVQTRSTLELHSRLQDYSILQLYDSCINAKMFEKTKWIALCDCLDKIQLSHKNKQFATWDTENKLYTEFAKVFPFGNSAAIWTAFINKLTIK